MSMPYKGYQNTEKDLEKRFKNDLKSEKSIAQGERFRKLSLFSFIKEEAKT